MSPLHKAITITTTILFLALSGNVMAINKCVSPSGETSFTDKPCPAGSTSDTVKLRPDHHISDTSHKAGGNASKLNGATEQAKSKQQSIASEGWKKRWPTLQAYKEYYCSQNSGRTRAPDEMIADAKAVSSGDLPSMTVCCMNNKPVACK